MGERRRAGEDNPLPARGGGAGNARRLLALGRQKEELRRERDQLLLDLERNHGRARLAEMFGLEQGSLGRLLEGARERQRAREPGFGGAGASEIAVRRLGARSRVRLVAGAATAAGRRRRPQGAPDGYGPAGEGPPRIVQRRGRPAQEGGRWAEADSHYETLGRASRLG